MRKGLGLYVALMCEHCLTWDSGISVPHHRGNITTNHSRNWL